MKPISLEMGKPVFQNISVNIKAGSRSAGLSLRFCLLVFLLVAVLDVILTARNHSFIDAAVTAALILFTVFFAFVPTNPNNKNALTALYSVVLIGISGAVLYYGFSTGCYFYLFPCTVVYIININDIKGKEKFSSFFTYSIILFAWISLFVMFSLSSVNDMLLRNLFSIRLAASVLLSALFIKYIVSVFMAREAKARVNTNSDILFDANHEGYIVIDKESQEIVDCNQFAYRLFKIEKSTDLQGLFITQFMMRHLAAGSENMDTLMNPLPENWAGEGVFTTTDKKEFNAIINTFTYYKDEKVYQIIGIRDVSELKKAETDLNYYKDKLDKSVQVKTRFLSNMSHELRTPLNGIIGSANLILAEQNLPDKIKTQTNLQLYSSEHMLSIINDILDFTKIESGKMELKMLPFNLLEALNFLMKSIEGQFTRSEVKLIADFDAALADVEIVSDVVKLRQILFNLISNALKFTFDGHVAITATIKNSDAGNVTVLFCVQDTGIGIKKEKQADIFNDFVQVHDENANRKFGGTGLGLTISEKLVNLFGGKIELESEIGKGTCFSFTLNFAKVIKQTATVVQAIESDKYEAPVDIRGIRVLVVEDNEINAAILIKFLSKWDIRIKEAGNGVQALELMKYHTFDLVLMDLEMPELNGYETIKIIRETDKNLHVIAFTATLLENMDTLIVDYGFDDFILKPFRPSDLKKKIEKYVQHRKIEYA